MTSRVMEECKLRTSFGLYQNFVSEKRPFTEDYLLFVDISIFDIYVLKNHIYDEHYAQIIKRIIIG